MPQPQTIAVVPIFITAGSAVLPTILAAVAGAAAVLLRPRELLGLVRRRPVTSVGTAAAIALAAWGVVHVATAKAAPTKAAAGTDWAAVAREIIARQNAAVPAWRPAIPPVAATAAAVVEGRDYSRSSYDGGPSPRGLKALWTYAPEDTMFLATPAAAGERVFVAGCVAGLGDYTGLVACLDAATGKPVWEVTEVNGEPLKAVFSSPAVSADGKSLVVGQGFHQDRNCALLCLDAVTGKLKWSAASTEHIESSPAIVGDTAVVGVGAIEDHAGRPTGDAGYLMAVRVSDGQLLWKQPVVDAESSPAIDADGTVIAGSGLNGQAVIAFNGGITAQFAQDRIPPGLAQAWKTPVGLSVTGTVTLAGDLVVVGAGNGDFAHSNASPEGAVVAVDRRTGKEHWRAKLADSVLGPIAFRDGLLVAPTRVGEVVALDAASGRERWRAGVSGASPVLGGCALTDTLVYVQAADATLAVLDRASGKVLEKHALNDPAKAGSGLSSAAPQVAGGRVVVGTETGGVRCLVGTSEAMSR